MATEHKDYYSNDFELKQNHDYVKRSRITKTIGKIIVFSIIAAGLSGLLGYGIWTKKKLTLQNGDQVEYESLMRAKRETPLVVYCGSPRGEDSLLRITFQDDYLEKVAIREVTPWPVSMQLEGNKVVYLFKRGGTETGQIRFTTYASVPGTSELLMEVEDQQQVIKQFIYP
jgi:hypothetical protein